MLYTLDQGQLLRIRTVIRYLGIIREIPDPTAQAAVLTDAQILLTAFVLDLEPLPGDQAYPVTTRTHLDEVTRFDA
jgi:hypothetical protein